MRSEEEVKERLREYHSDYLLKEMGGMKSFYKAQALLWVLGHDSPDPRISGQFPPRNVDVSDYIETENA